jgi:hypothetical protein
MQSEEERACRSGWAIRLQARTVGGWPARPRPEEEEEGKPEFVGCSLNYCAAASQGTAMRPWHGEGSLPAMAAA